MNVGQLKEFLADLPKEMTVVISKAVIIDKEDDLVGVLDYPVIGVVKNEKGEELELRFILDSDGAKECFSPSEVKLFDKWEQL